MTVQLTVTDVNDNAPQFDQIIFTATVPEYLAQGSSVLRVCVYSVPLTLPPSSPSPPSSLHPPLILPPSSLVSAQVNAVDPDSAGANSQVVYSLMVGADDPFIINPVTGMSPPPPSSPSS